MKSNLGHSFLTREDKRQIRKFNKKWKFFYTHPCSCRNFLRDYNFIIVTGANNACSGIRLVSRKINLQRSSFCFIIRKHFIFMMRVQSIFEERFCESEKQLHVHGNSHDSGLSFFLVKNYKNDIWIAEMKTSKGCFIFAI